MFPLSMLKERLIFSYWAQRCVLLYFHFSTIVTKKIVYNHSELLIFVLQRMCQSMHSKAQESADLTRGIQQHPNLPGGFYIFPMTFFPLL